MQVSPDICSYCLKREYNFRVMDEVVDVLIIGSGPAGLTAGIYASRAGLSTIILAGESWGGQLMLTTEVENYPGFPEGIQGPELMERMRKQAERFGAKFISESASRVDFSKQPLQVNSYRTRSVIVATGAKTKWLDLPNEQRLIGRGVSSCAPCDAPFFRNKRVIVVGGGDSAMEEARVLAKFASEVTLVHRSELFKASQIMLDQVKSNPNIKMMMNSEVVDVVGEAKVEGVKIKDTKTGEVRDMPIDGVFVAIGHIPDCALFKAHIETDDRGYIKSGRHGEFAGHDDSTEEVHHHYHTMTSAIGVFTAGDVHDYRYRQAVTAAGYGCEAALDAERWLEENRQKLPA